MTQQLVVIGNGMAPGRVLEELFEQENHGYQVTVFNAEPRVNYDRIMLSPVLSGEKAYEDIVIHGDSWYAENGVTLHKGKPIIDINRKTRIVKAVDGTSVKYDKLLIATGSSPFIPPISGKDLHGVFTYRDLDDVDGMLEAAESGGRAVVIGGGLLGLEAAAGLQMRGMDVTVLHLGPTIMERQLDTAGGFLLKEALTERGISVITEANTTAILGDTKVEGVQLSTGEVIDASIVVIAVGIRPNTTLAEGCELTVNRGIVVDDAIVVLENIYSKIEQGMPAQQAGIECTREIFMAVIATTLALVAVFMPILFLSGLTGRLFREFGMVIGGSVVISSFVALTLTPMLGTRLLKGKNDHSWFYYKTEPFFKRLTKSYRSSVVSFMKMRWLAFPVLIGSMALIVFFFRMLPSELAPMEDRNSVRGFATAPEGATYEYMDAYVDQLIKITQENVPEAEAIISVTSPGFGSSSSVNSGFVFMTLKPPSERDRSQQEIADQLAGLTQGLTQARTFVSQPETIGQGGGFGLPVQYVIQAPSFDKLTEFLPRFLEAARQDPTFTYTDVNLKFNKPELQISIDRERARALGVSALDIAQTLQLALSEQRLGYFIMDGKQYQVIGQVERRNRIETRDLKSIYTRNSRGEPVQLDNVVTISEESSPPQLFRFNRFVSATVSAGVVPGKTIGDGIEAMNRIAGEVLDPSFSTDLAGPSRDFAESSSSLLFVFMLALLLIYLVLAAQFESFRDPLTIMLSVPLALAGALFWLWYFNQTLNIFSEIGMIMLIGLVTKNGILIVEFANQRKEAGLKVFDAALEAATARFRPILMTSISTTLGILPIALALGAGAESRVPMGIAVIGGLLVGTVLTLYVIPAVYSYLTSENSTTRLAQSDTEEAAEAVVGH